METITFENDMKVLYVTASAFPEGIGDTFKKLNEIVPHSKDRKYFGISRPENGVIVYKAAAEQLNEDEGEKLNCDTLIIKKGKYVSKTINDFMNDIPSIGKTFGELLKNPGIDPDGYCVEWYFNDKDVRCMVRLS